MNVFNERYERGHPAGYTDDLGIIADENRWIKALKPGWYFLIETEQFEELSDWCHNNLLGYWELVLELDMGPIFSLYVESYKDAVWFKLRWS